MMTLDFSVQGLGQRENMETLTKSTVQFSSAGCSEVLESILNMTAKSLAHPTSQTTHWDTNLLPNFTDNRGREAPWKCHFKFVFFPRQRQMDRFGESNINQGAQPIMGSHLMMQGRRVDFLSTMGFSFVPVPQAQGGLGMPSLGVAFFSWFLDSSNLSGWCRHGDQFGPSPWCWFIHKHLQLNQMLAKKEHQLWWAETVIRWMQSWVGNLKCHNKDVHPLPLHRHQFLLSLSTLGQSPLGISTLELEEPARMTNREDFTTLWTACSSNKAARAPDSELEDSQTASYIFWSWYSSQGGSEMVWGGIWQEQFSHTFSTRAFSETP